MITCHHLQDFREYDEAVELQRRIWGFAEVEIIPARLFLMARDVGGQAIGAFDDARLIGFCLSIPALKWNGAERGFLHSHMLGVLPEYRNRGIGRRLKLEQRSDALSRGIHLIEWTFDPLEIKNAFLNIERLGVIVRRYVLNQYGITTSKLHTGMPTDRCVAEWRLDTPRTEAIIEGEPRERTPVLAQIAVPAAIEKLRRENVAKALRIQKDVSGKFLEHFDRDLAVTGFEITEQAGTYLFSRWP